MPTIKLFDKQADFFESNQRINGYVGGIQSGKTMCGAVRMHVSNMHHRSPDDTFIIAADTYKTLRQASIPRFLKFSGRWGKMNWGLGEFKFSWGTTVYFRTATDPESMEGITNVRRIWVDEAGKISKYFFENCMGRAAFREAPIDLTTTPYALNWLFKLHRSWQLGKESDSHFVTCRSIDSPYFPKAAETRPPPVPNEVRGAVRKDGGAGLPGHELLHVHGAACGHQVLCRNRLGLLSGSLCDGA
jgi:hypothetical protein